MSAHLACISHRLTAWLVRPGNNQPPGSSRLRRRPSRHQARSSSRSCGESREALRRHALRTHRIFPISKKGEGSAACLAFQPVAVGKNSVGLCIAWRSLRPLPRSARSSIRSESISPGDQLVGRADDRRGFSRRSGRHSDHRRRLGHSRGLGLYRHIGLCTCRCQPCTAVQVSAQAPSSSPRQDCSTVGFATTLRVEFGPAAAARRERAMRRIVVDKWLAPLGAGLAGPEALPAEAFEQRTIDALLGRQLSA
jgi:hypothetical protein